MTRYARYVLIGCLSGLVLVWMYFVFWSPTDRGKDSESGSIIFSTQTQSGCGDALLTGDEQCDDGNIWDGDGCSSACLIEE